LFSLKKFIILICLIALTISPNYALFQLNNPMEISASTINETIDQLLIKYPEHIAVEIIGYSVENQPIKVLRISNDIHSTDLTIRYNQNKKNSLFLAGLHAKEVITPLVFLEIVNDNLEALVNGDEAIKSTLDNNIIHFIPLMNPDGFDLAKHGEVHEIFGSDFNEYLKANTNGVDLNNNFPDKFYDLELGQWHSIEEKAHLPSNYISYEPSVAYYWGTEIQPETEAVVEYMKRCYFEYFVDLHSQGDYIYWDHWHLSDIFREENLNFAMKIQEISTSNDFPYAYELGERNIAEAPHGFGYSTAYFASLYDNPAITLEVARLSNLPYATSDHYYEAINRLKDIFIELDNYKVEHSPHRVYKDQELFSDYSHEEYAKAVAKEINGLYIYDSGDLKTYSGNVINPNLFNNLSIFFNRKLSSLIIETIEQIKSTPQ